MSELPTQNSVHDKEKQATSRSSSDWNRKQRVQNWRTVIFNQHVDLIAKHEQDFLSRRTAAERVGDAIASFAGTLTFVCIHAVLISLWFATNAHSHSRFLPDPPPFSLLSTILAIEAIFLASFILMRQNRMSRRADEREHLMLQILLLAEKEITTVLSLEREIAAKLGIANIRDNKDVQELSEHTSIEDVAQSIKDAFPISE